MYDVNAENLVALFGSVRSSSGLRIRGPESGIQDLGPAARSTKVPATRARKLPIRESGEIHQPAYQLEVAASPADRLKSSCWKSLHYTYFQSSHLIMVLEIISQVISVAEAVYKLCQEMAETRGTIQLVGEKMKVLVGVLRAIPTSATRVSGFQDSLDSLRKAINGIHTDINKAVRLSRMMYAYKAKDIRCELEKKMRNIQDYVDYLSLAHNVELSAKVDAMHDSWEGFDHRLGAQAKKKEREEKAELLRILNETNEQLQAAELARVYGLRERTDLITSLAESQHDHAETQRKLGSITDEIARSKAEADSFHMNQIISALTFASEHAAPTMSTTPSTAAPEIPEWCICPISLCVMEDPVRIDSSCHHIFERAKIYEWVVTLGNSKCPMDNIRLRSKVLSPSAQIREAIASWRDQQSLTNGPTISSSPAGQSQRTADLEAQVEAMRAQMANMQRMPVTTPTYTTPVVPPTRSTTRVSTARVGSLEAGHTNDVNCCAIFDNGQKALSGSRDKTLRVWNLATGQTIQTLTGHTSTVTCCAVFDNGQKVLSGSKDNTLRVWDLT